MLLDPVPDEHKENLTPGPVPTASNRAQGQDRSAGRAPSCRGSPPVPAGVARSTACASPVMSSALRMCRAETSVSAEWTSRRSQPSASPAPSSRGTKTASPRLAPRPKERASAVPARSRGAAAPTRSRRCRRTRRRRPHSRSDGAGPRGARRPVELLPPVVQPLLFHQPPRPSRCQRSSVVNLRTDR